MVRVEVIRGGPRLLGGGRRWLRRRRRSGSRDLFVVMDDLGNDEVEDLLREDRVQPRGSGEASQPGQLLLLAAGIGGRQAEICLEMTDPLGAPEAFGQQVDQGGVEVVDARAQGGEFRGHGHGHEGMPYSPLCALPVPPRPCGSAFAESHDAVMGLGPLADDRGDPARATVCGGLGSQQLGQGVQGLRGSLGDDLDPAVLEIAGVSDQAELQSSGPGPPAKADSLDVPRHEGREPLSGHHRTSLGKVRGIRVEGVGPTEEVLHEVGSIPRPTWAQNPVAVARSDVDVEHVVTIEGREEVLSDDE